MKFRLIHQLLIAFALILLLPHSTPLLFQDILFKKNFQLIKSLCPPILGNSHRLISTRDNSQVNFYLFNRWSYPLQIYTWDLRHGSLSSLKFSMGKNSQQKKLKVIIHGWTSNYLATSPNILRNAYESVNEDINILLIDWSSLSLRENYGFAANNTEFVGMKLAEMLQFLVTQRLTWKENIHLIGISLGSHVAGFTGKFLLMNYGWKPSRITALDPAQPCFINISSQKRLNPLDADFVDVIHSNAGQQGINFPIGSVDFYPNGGVVQPGCGFNLICSHRRAYEYMAESITTRTGFIATKCKSYRQYKLQQCKGKERILMGEYTPKSARGMYYLDTNPYMPFAKG